MSEMWKRWEGQVIDHKYQLRQFLGSTDHSAVFRAEFHDPELRNAAVKFLAADLPHAEEVLADWKRGQQLQHPNLLPMYSVGRCTIEDMDLLYAAMEFGDENLAEILPHRALTSAEAQEMLSVVADVLVHLHGNKLTHGHIKPANIFAIGDQLKLSSDTIQSLEKPREMRRKRDVYDAPEIPASAYTPAADIWSLGVTVVEALTQQPAVLPYNENAEPVVGPSVREPFREVATHALRRDPSQRWTSVEIAVHLNPEKGETVRAALAAVAATAAGSPASASSAVMNSTATAPLTAVAVAAPPPAASAQATFVSPLSVPLSKEPPLGKQGSIKPVTLKPPMPPPSVARPEAKKEARKPIVLPNYFVPVLAVVLILVAAIALPKVLHRTTQPAVESAASSAGKNATAQNTNSGAAAVTQSSATVANPAASQPAPSSAPPDSHSASGSSSNDLSARRTASSSPTSSPALLRNPGSAPIASTRKAASPDRGEVLDQVLPRPGSSALATIQGTLRVLVRVHVDPSGNVQEASLDHPAPSKYFADKSLQAARGWVFLAPVADGHSQATEWQIRFEFTPSGVNAYPKQITP